MLAPGEFRSLDSVDPAHLDDDSHSSAPEGGARSAAEEGEDAGAVYHQYDPGLPDDESLFLLATFEDGISILEEEIRHPSCNLLIFSGSMPIKDGRGNSCPEQT